MSTTNIHIMHTAAELWELAGPDMWLYRWTEDGHALMQGKLTYRVRMTREEFSEYQDQRRRFQQPWREEWPALDLAGAPTISMQEVTADEDVFGQEVRSSGGALSLDNRRRIYDSLRTELRLIRDLVGAAKHSLSVEDYGDALAGAFDRLGVCIGCVDGLRERGADEEMGRRGDAERADHEDDDDVLEALNEWHREDSRECEAGLLKDVPPEGGYAPWAVLRNLVGCAFLEGAVAQLTRPFVRKKGGPEAA